VLSKRATIQDVADYAGVSRAAVSKVLRNAYGLSDEMRARVEAAMKALDYRPQPQARGLRGRTYTLGISLPEIRNPFFPDLLDGILEALRPSPYQPLIGVRPSADATERDTIDMMIDRKVDGLILVAPHLPADYFARVTGAIPAVVLGRHERDGGFDTVNNDDAAGAEMVVDELVARGHRRIAYLGLEIDEVGETNSTSLRYDGYLAAMRRHGLADRVLVGNSSHRGGAKPAQDVARELLSDPDRPTAIFAWFDTVAITVMSVAAEMGLSVPGDLSVVGYDNSSVAALPQVGLTSVDQSGRLLGETGARLVMERIDGRTDEMHFLVQPKLFVRRSIAAPKMR
jgi:DNA-binding LacI/PurR family transcriptional regulator